MFFTRNINNSHWIRLSASLTASREPNHRSTQPLKTVEQIVFFEASDQKPSRATSMETTDGSCRERGEWREEEKVEHFSEESVME